MLPYVLIGGGVAILLAIVIGFGIYNRLVTLRNRYQNAYSQIDVQLKRRYDLIPNMIEAARGYLQHEKQTLEAVIAARNAAVAANAGAAAHPGAASALATLIGAESVLAGTLGRFMALSERYPDLKADRTMARLMEELTSTENRIAFARQAYNDGVTQYNIARQRVPNVLVAGMCGFEPAALFELPSPREAEVPQVALS